MAATRAARLSARVFRTTGASALIPLARGRCDPNRLNPVAGEKNPFTTCIVQPQERQLPLLSIDAGEALETDPALEPRRGHT